MLMYKMAKLPNTKPTPTTQGKLQPIPRGASLSLANKTKLAKHAQNHDTGHIRSMRMRMLKGKSFEMAHKEALNRPSKVP